MEHSVTFSRQAGALMWLCAFDFAQTTNKQMMMNAAACHQLLEVRICFWQPSWVCLASLITWQVQLLAASMPRLAPGADRSTMSKACVVVACLSVTVLGTILTLRFARSAALLTAARPCDRPAMLENRNTTTGQLYE